jgi:hypothetical protein
MRTRASVVVALLAFVAGAALVWVLRETPVEPGSAPQRTGDGVGIEKLVLRLDSIDRRLQGIEDAVAGLSPPAHADPQALAATRSDAADMSQVRHELEALADEVRIRLAGLGELQAKKPPDLDAVAEFGKRTNGDQRLVGDAVRGLTYRDLVLQFGSPTSKFAPLTGPNKFRLEAWLWETPSGDLDVEFSQNVAVGGFFRSPGVMRKFLEESK